MDTKRSIWWSWRDGTVNYVVNRMKEKHLDLLLGIIPAGTANDFAGALGMEKNPVKAAAQLLGGTEERVDCGRVNDHYFVNIFSFGIFTTTSQRTPDKRKHQIGKLAYLIEGVKEFRSVHGIPLQILADGKAFDLESLMALIFNGETAGGFHLAPRSSIKDGMFDCLLLQRRNMLFSVVSMLRHLLGGRPSQVKHFRARTLDITSPINEPTDMDGQKGADFPLHIECLHNELRVVCPLSEAPRRGRFAYFKNLISKLAWWRTR
jgi:diacylglycerol kinase (ATP)